jgi:hypothetical protein
MALIAIGFSNGRHSFRNPCCCDKGPNFVELEHDPEKWVPVLRRDYAQTTRWSGMTIRRKVISLWAGVHVDVRVTHFCGVDRFSIIRILDELFVGPMPSVPAPPYRTPNQPARD